MAFGREMSVLITFTLSLPSHLHLIQRLLFVQEQFFLAARFIGELPVESTAFLS